MNEADFALERASGRMGGGRRNEADEALDGHGAPESGGGGGGEGAVKQSPEQCFMEYKVPLTVFQWVMCVSVPIIIIITVSLAPAGVAAEQTRVLRCTAQRMDVLECNSRVPGPGHAGHCRGFAYPAQYMCHSGRRSQSRRTLRLRTRWIAHSIQ